MIQLQFLNKLLATKNASLLTVNNLNHEFFSDYLNEYRFIQSHLDQYGTIPDVETFVSKFPDFDVLNVNETDKYLLDALYEDRNKRVIAKAYNQVREDLQKGDVDKALSNCVKLSDNLAQAKHLEAVDLFKDLSRYDSYVDRTTNFSKYYVGTGFSELDEILGGWDRKEELAVVAARTNSGKSWILLKTAIAAAEQGLTVGIYSGEMSENKVGYRIDTLMSHISNSKIIHGNIEVQAQYKKFLQDVQRSLKGKILVLTPKMINGTAGVNALRAFIEKENLDMLCIDQHSLLEDDRGARNPVERASNISKDLKNLQVMTQIPIISVSQQNREKNETGTPGTENISQSDRIGQDATTIIFFDQKEDKSLDNYNKLLTMYLVKSRDSANGMQIKYSVNFNTGTFIYIPSEEDALKGSSCEDLKDEYEYEDDYGDSFN